MSSKITPEQQTFLQMREELIADTIGTRAKLILLAETPEKRRFPILEVATKVSENTWRTWWKRGGTPSGALIEGLGRAWPEYAFWLTTGMTDVEYGHRMPKLHDSVVGYLSNWPEGKLKNDRVYAGEYFKICRDIQDLNKQGYSKVPAQQFEILENSRKFIADKRHEEIRKGLKVNEWTGNEE